MPSFSSSLTLSRRSTTMECSLALVAAADAALNERRTAAAAAGSRGAVPMVVRATMGAAIVAMRAAIGRTAAIEMRCSMVTKARRGEARRTRMADREIGFEPVDQDLAASGGRRIKELK